ncbi:uncharacterized protein EAE97_003296 [Botrytis byssoidea]|uniref:Uncharacterized protein n=1 Tax=Botrytis byssoidea TaxID=139641 RepID=A0A9P5LX90_9HELO|nr:uncharacterized protein EAE97_003296 [Botrytis byssoidea]KAF7949787.1 hypothetical protein EAE97_003296 [Botrytis byssoidea]
MGRAKFQRRKGRSHNKIMPGASLKGHLMAKGFNAAAARQTLKLQKKHCRLVNERADIKSQNWANSIRVQKEKCLLLDLLPEVRLTIWEFCILNLPCGRKPITVAISQPQLNRDRHVFEGRPPLHRNKKFYAQERAYFRQKYFDQVHPTFRAQIFNLLMICRQAYLEIEGGALLYKIKTFKFLEQMTLFRFCFKIRRHFFFIQSMILEYDISRNRDFTFVNSTFRMIFRCCNLKKFRMKMRILSRELAREGAPAFRFQGTLLPNYHGQAVLHKLCRCPELWKWNLKPERVDKIKDFDIDVSGDDAWPSYFRFGGDKKGWHLVRNLHAMHNIDMSELVQRLTERYPYYQKRGVKEQTSNRIENIWVDVCEPILVPETALKLLQEKNEKAERERLEMERLEEISEE